MYTWDLNLLHLQNLIVSCTTKHCSSTIQCAVQCSIVRIPPHQVLSSDIITVT